MSQVGRTACAEEWRWDGPGPPEEEQCSSATLAGGVGLGDRLWVRTAMILGLGFVQRAAGSRGRGSSGEAGKGPWGQLSLSIGTWKGKEPGILWLEGRRGQLRRYSTRSCLFD